MLTFALEHHPHRSFSHLGRVPRCSCHDPILLGKSVSGQSRGGSLAPTQDRSANSGSRFCTGGGSKCACTQVSPSLPSEPGSGYHVALLLPQAGGRDTEEQCRSPQRRVVLALDALALYWLKKVQPDRAGGALYHLESPAKSFTRDDQVRSGHGVRKTQARRSQSGKMNNAKRDSVGASGIGPDARCLLAFERWGQCEHLTGQGPKAASDSTKGSILLPAGRDAWRILETMKAVAAARARKPRLLHDLASMWQPPRCRYGNR